MQTNYLHESAAVRQALQGVLRHLRVRDLSAVRCTSRAWQDIVQAAGPALWQNLASRHFQQGHPVFQCSPEEQKHQFLHWHRLHCSIRSQGPARILPEVTHNPSDRIVSPDMRYLVHYEDVGDKHCFRISTVGPAGECTPFYGTQCEELLLCWSPDSTKALLCVRGDRLRTYYVLDLQNPRCSSA